MHEHLDVRIAVHAERAKINNIYADKASPEAGGPYAISAALHELGITLITLATHLYPNIVLEKYTGLDRAHLDGLWRMLGITPPKDHGEPQTE